MPHRPDRSLRLALTRVGRGAPRQNVLEPENSICTDSIHDEIEQCDRAFRQQNGFLSLVDSLLHERFERSVFRIRPASHHLEIHHQSVE